VCASVLVLMSGVFTEINLDDPRVQASLSALAQAGVLTAAQMAEIDALADVPGVARWQALGLAAAVTVEDVQAAWDWIAAQEAEATRRAACPSLSRWIMAWSTLWTQRESSNYVDSQRNQQRHQRRPAARDGAVCAS